MNRKFKAPPSTDIKQWEKVQFLSDHGFRFGSIVDAEGFRVPYPGTLQEARKFVRDYADRPTARWLTEDGPPKGKRLSRKKGPQGTSVDVREKRHVTPKKDKKKK
jgi:hypothetical protein